MANNPEEFNRAKTIVEPLFIQILNNGIKYKISEKDNTIKNYIKYEFISIESASTERDRKCHIDIDTFDNLYEHILFDVKSITPSNFRDNNNHNYSITIDCWDFLNKRYIENNLQYKFHYLAFQMIENKQYLNKFIVVNSYYLITKNIVFLSKTGDNYLVSYKELCNLDNCYIYESDI